MKYRIIDLPKEKWKGTVLPIRYTTDKYYHVAINRTNKGFAIDIQKKDPEQPIIRRPEEYDFPDRLYEDHWENAFAWGVVIDGELIAAIETNPDLWSNRLRITELWVAEKYQRQGIGHALIEMAKEQARLEGRRAVILETQSCNVNAIDFYLHEGFTLIGLDTCCYSNNDLQRKEVRLEFGWFPERRNKLSREDVEIRMERESDWYAVELMTQRAFWNKYAPGCDEHYLIHKLRQHKDYLPELSRVAVKDGKIIGCILYSRSKVVDGEDVHETITFGPISVEPEWQACGVGGLLINETMKLAAAEGYKGIIIFGDPKYYSRFGFKPCKNFGITTSDGKNFDEFMAVELTKDSLKGVKGKFYESEVFNNIDKGEVEEYNKRFPKLRKMKFPGQFS